MKKRLTLIIFLILVVMLLPAKAYKGSASQTTKKKNGWLIVTSSEDGVMAHYTGKKTKVTVPNGVNNLASLSSSVREVHLSSSVYEVNGLIAKNLKKITVASGNGTFIAKDGVLFDKSGENLSFYPSKRKATSYIVPKGVKSITQIKNNHLRTLNLPDSLEIIYNIESKKMTKLFIPPNVHYMDDINIPGQIIIARNNRHFIMSKGVLFNKKKTKIFLYPARKKGKKYTLPKGVRDVDSGAFYNNKHLKTIHIPQYTKWKSLLYSNTIPFAYANSLSLEKFTVSSKNPHFRARSGVLYNKKMTQLHVYPSGRKNKSFTVPESVTNISYSAFENIKIKLKVTLPDNIQSIGSPDSGDKGYNNITFMVKNNSISHKTVVKLGLKYTLK